jgi:hypothetical protein
LSYTSSPFCSGYFEDGISLFVPAGLYLWSSRFQLPSS